MIVFYVIEDAQMEIDFNDGIELAATDSADHVAICYCTTFGWDAMVLNHPLGVISSLGASPLGMK